MKEAIGIGPATTFLAGMPPVGWADVATKRDLDHLADRIHGDLQRRINELQRNLFFGMLAAQATFAGIAIALVR